MAVAGREAVLRVLATETPPWNEEAGPRLPHTRPQSSAPRVAPHLSSQARALPFAMSFGVFPLLVVAFSASVRASADHRRKVC